MRFATRLHQASLKRQQRELNNALAPLWLSSAHTIIHISYASAAHRFFASSKSSLWATSLLIDLVKLWIVPRGPWESVRAKERGQNTSSGLAEWL